MCIVNDPSCVNGEQRKSKFLSQEVRVCKRSVHPAVRWPLYISAAQSHWSTAQSQFHLEFEEGGPHSPSIRISDARLQMAFSTEFT